MGKTPNIVFLFTDQQRYDTIAALGNQRICTPALDAVAKEAVVFDRCYTPAPVCVPARFSMFSGLYPGHAGCCNNNSTVSYKGEGFYSAFTKSGYETCCVGKMHHPTDPYGPMGFCKRLTQEEMAAPEDDYTQFIMNSPFRNVFDYNGVRSEMYYIPQVSQLPMEYHPTQWVGDRSVEFLETCDGHKPFFLMASFIHPHPPFAPPAPWNKMYRSVSEDPYMPEKPDEFAPFLSDRFTRDKIGISRQDLSLLKNFYYSCISFVDYQIGRILSVLRKRGLDKDTVIVFSSDHGEMLGDFGTMGKRSMLDGAVHIPLLIRVPGMPAGRRTDVCSLVDIAPTLFSLAGIPYEKTDLDGLDLFGSEHHELVYSQYSTGKNGTYMAASNHDKLVYSGPCDKYFYFDSVPEKTNTYREDQPRIRELKTFLDRYRAEDSCADGSGATDAVSGISKFPYGPKRADHLMRHDEELARMPDGYRIDL